MKTKMHLVSDFTDYYDHRFDLKSESSLEFRRMSTEGGNKLEQAHILVSLGLDVPPIGTLRDLEPKRRDFYTQIGEEWEQKFYAHANDNEYVVVYVDPTKHRGEGKLLMTWNEAIASHQDKICACYIPHSGKFPTSLRHLQVGDRSFFLAYKSDDAWRSNCGNVEITVLGERPESTRVSYPNVAPLFAVDFVMGNQGQWIAVDFNLAPQIRGTGIEDVLPATEAHEAIIRALKATHEKAGE